MREAVARLAERANARQLPGLRRVGRHTRTAAMSSNNRDLTAEIRTQERDRAAENILVLVVMTKTSLNLPETGPSRLVSFLNRTVPDTGGSNVCDERFREAAELRAGHILSPGGRRAFLQQPLEREGGV